ncbi:MAG TPA: hypothetical protein VIZ63_02325 [Povalibacter sp.]
MQLRTRFTELVGIDYPIVQGGMMCGSDAPNSRQLFPTPAVSAS